MRRIRFIPRLAPFLAFLAYPGRVSAQIAGGNASNAPPLSSGWGETASVVVVAVVLLLAFGGGVRFYDVKRKREDEALLIESRISDALLREFGTLPVIAVVSGSHWRRAPIVVAITGRVPKPELRESVMHVVQQELSRYRPDARAEDRLVVDPLVRSERAGATTSLS
jgi:hypothetical protein